MIIDINLFLFIGYFIYLCAHIKGNLGLNIKYYCDENKNSTMQY